MQPSQRQIVHVTCIPHEWPCGSFTPDRSECFSSHVPFVSSYSLRRYFPHGGKAMRSCRHYRSLCDAHQALLMCSAYVGHRPTLSRGLSTFGLYPMCCVVSTFSLSCVPTKCAARRTGCPMFHATHHNLHLYPAARIAHAAVSSGRLFAVPTTQTPTIRYHEHEVITKP